VAIEACGVSGCSFRRDLMSSKTWRSGVVEEQLVEAGLCARARSVEVSLLDLESDAVARLTISAKISICTTTQLWTILEL